jgi:hypothetical protein
MQVRRVAELYRQTASAQLGSLSFLHCLISNLKWLDQRQTDLVVVEVGSYYKSYVCVTESNIIDQIRVYYVQIKTMI